MFNLLIVCFVSLVSGFSSLSTRSNNDDHVLIDREITEKKILDYQDSHYLLSFTDYASKSFVYHLLTEWDLWNLAINDSINIGGLNGQVVLTSNLVMNSWGQSTLNAQFVRINILRGNDIITGGGGSAGDHGERMIRFKHFTTTFYSAENSASISFMFDVAYAEYSNSGVQWYNYDGNFINVYSFPTDKCIMLYKGVANNYVYLGMLYFDEEVINEIAQNEAYNSGFADGRQVGYEEFLDESQYNPEMLTIFTGIINIALLPVNYFLAIFNFEVFGINIAGFISSLLTVSIIIIILRLILGGKSNDK